MDMRYLTRNVNEGFSGGEKKRNEILQVRSRSDQPLRPLAASARRATTCDAVTLHR